MVRVKGVVSPFVDLCSPTSYASWQFEGIEVLLHFEVQDAATNPTFTAITTITVTANTITNTNTATPNTARPRQRTFENATPQQRNRMRGRYLINIRHDHERRAM
jgi:hypothetical protein